LSVPHVVLLNDLGATGHSIEHLPPEDFCVLNPGKPEPGGTRALIAAGTGLGQSFSRLGRRPLPRGAFRRRPLRLRPAPPSSKSNCCASCAAAIRKSAGKLILSGRGFRTIHEFLAPKVTHASFEDPDADPAPEITRRGLDKSCRVCSDTLDLWTAIYGAEAGNLALKVLALGGVYVAGGIAVKILEKMKDGTFFHAFKDKWKFEGLLSNIPVSIVLNESAPLLGAAYEALAAIDK